MANKEIFLRGKARWFKLLGKGDGKYEQWSTVLYLTPESYSQFLELQKGNDTTNGIMNEVSKDEDGYHVNLKRPWRRKNQQGRPEQMLTPPVVIDINGVPWSEDKQVGNGSDVTVKCEYYTFKPPFSAKKGSAIRLVSCRIEDHVPYEPKRDLTADLVEATKGLAGGPIQYF